MQSRNVHDLLTEIVLYKQKQLDDISERRSKMLFSGWSDSFPFISPIPILQIQEVHKEIIS